MSKKPKKQILDIQTKNFSFQSTEDENENIRTNFSKNIENGTVVSGFGSVNWKAFPGETDEEKKAAALKFASMLSSTL